MAWVGGWVVASGRVGSTLRVDLRARCATCDALRVVCLAMATGVAHWVADAIRSSL